MKWQIDNSQSKVEFTIKKFWGLVTVKGTFRQFEGDFNFEEGKSQDWEAQVTLQADSLATANARRDAHIRTTDFFDIEKYPTLTFRSTRVEEVSPHQFKLYGNLTIRDITHPVTLDVTSNTTANQPSFTATADLARRDWGLNWNKIPIGPVAHLTLEVVAVPVGVTTGSTSKAPTAKSV